MWNLIWADKSSYSIASDLSLNYHACWVVRGFTTCFGSGEKHHNFFHTTPRRCVPECLGIVFRAPQRFLELSVAVLYIQCCSVV